MTLFAGKEWRRRCREQTWGHSGTNGEGSIDTYTLSDVKRRAVGKLLHKTGSPALRSVVAEKGEAWGEEGESRAR